jgi:N-methylhydantoinase A
VPRLEAVAPTFGIAVDIGGTFTDVVLRSSEGAVFADKVLTTHADLLAGALTALRHVLGKAAIGSAAVSDLFVHATTIVTNALIERKGTPTALLVTEGFRDVLIIRNEHRYEMFDPQIEFPAPLVPRHLTFEVEERMLAGGTEYQPLNKAKALDAISGLRRMVPGRSPSVC